MAIRASRESLWISPSVSSSWAPRFGPVVVGWSNIVAELADPSATVTPNPSGIVIDRDALADGHRLAGQHIAGLNLFIGQAVTGGHLDLAFGDLGAAGRADARLAGKGSGQSGLARAVEDVGF